MKLITLALTLCISGVSFAQNTVTVRKAAKKDISGFYFTKPVKTTRITKDECCTTTEEFSKIRYYVVIKEDMETYFFTTTESPRKVHKNFEKCPMKYAPYIGMAMVEGEKVNMDLSTKDGTQVVYNANITEEFFELESGASGNVTRIINAPLNTYPIQ